MLATPFWGIFALLVLALWLALRWAATLPDATKQRETIRVICLVGLGIVLVWAAFSPAPFGWRP